jgi:hypothetical protein
VSQNVVMTRNDRFAMCMPSESAGDAVERTSAYSCTFGGMPETLTLVCAGHMKWGHGVRVVEHKRGVSQNVVMTRNDRFAMCMPSESAGDAVERTSAYSCTFGGMPETLMLVCAGHMKWGHGVRVVEHKQRGEPKCCHDTQ